MALGAAEGWVGPRTEPRGQRHSIYIAFWGRLEMHLKVKAELAPPPRDVYLVPPPLGRMCAPINFL